MSEATKISWWDETVSELGKMLDRKDARIAELERELASAPPASLPVRDVVVESEAARKLRERLRSPFALPFVSPTDWATLDYKRTAEILREFRDSAPPTIAPSESERVRLLTEQLNAQAKSHAEEGERWSREMGELKRELEALKAAPARVEREVESELRTAMAAHPTWALSDDVLRGNVADETMRLILAGRAWLAAPLSAAPAPSEERVTLYVVQAACSSGLYRCSADYQPRSNERVLALDARVVREGGA